MQVGAELDQKHSVQIRIQTLKHTRTTQNMWVVMSVIMEIFQETFSLSHLYCRVYVLYGYSIQSQLCYKCGMCCLGLCWDVLQKALYSVPITSTLTAVVLPEATICHKMINRECVALHLL